ncbi:MAG: hypothetical protein K2M87_04450, partial [Muribaculaceae bacterium]|nr:hypothetical protein [Muribaculaceae bacterium]
MKKTLLFTAAIALSSIGFANTGTPKMVQESVSGFTKSSHSMRYGAPKKAEGEAITFFSYAGDPAGVYSLDGVIPKAFVYEAVEFPVEDQQAYI